MYGEETAERQYSEYSENIFTQRESEYDIDTDTRKWEPSMSRKNKSLVKKNSPMYLEGVRTRGSRFRPSLKHSDNPATHVR